MCRNYTGTHRGTTLEGHDATVRFERQSASLLLEIEKESDILKCEASTAIRVPGERHMQWKKIILPASIFIAIVILLSACANTRSIEDTIMQFQNAANSQNFSSFKDTLSEDSDDWILGDSVIQDFLGTYLGANIPLTYSVTNIQETSDIDAIVDAQGNYFGFGSVTIRFIMRKHDQVWKIRQYWDNTGGTLDVIWQKIGDAVPLSEQP